jgi:subtilisin-like proprotein convertase family protein
MKAIFGAVILMVFVITSQHAFLQSRFTGDGKNVQQRNELNQFDTVLANDFVKGRRTNVKFDPATSRPSAIGSDQGLESEPNNTFATADVLTGTDGKIKASNFSGTSVPVATDPDWFSFTTTAANSKIYAAVIDSTASQQDSILDVFASDGTTILETDDQDGSFGGSASSIAGTVLATPGTYYLRVTNFSTTAPITPYDLYFAVRSGAPTAETEPNNNGTPQVMPASQYVSGVIDPLADTDTYSFNANAGDTVYLSLDLDPERDVTTFNGRIGLGLVGTPPNFLVTSDGGTFDTIDSEALAMTVKTTGAYQVYVDSQVATAGATQTYNFNLTIIPAAPAGTCTTYTNATSTPIPDLALTTSTISIPDSKIIRSLRVITDITHPNYPDLDVHLRSPSNNDNGIYTDVGVSTQTGPQNTYVADEGALPILFTVLNGVIWKPEPAYRLNWFNGENTLGTWSLDIRDDSTTVATPGTLNSWSLEVCEEAAPVGTLIYNENFEANNGGYTHTGTADEWEYGTPATAAQTVTSPFIAPFIGCASGTSCWKTDLDNTYDVSSSQDLTSPNLNLTNYQGTIRLYWQQRYQMESASFDHIWVRVTEVGNPANTRMVWNADNQTMSEAVGSGASLGNIGESAGWGRYNADISDFAGKNIQVTFHLDSETSVNLGGWAIDDVQLRQVGVVAASVPVTGRVTAGGIGIPKTLVTITNPVGGSRTAVTNGFGYYSFDDVEVGQNYIVSARRKGYEFEPRVVFVTEGTQVDFSAAP